MRVRAKVNETKVSLIHPGQRASLRIDAFPDQRVFGTVTEVTAISAPGSGPASDVRIYYANVSIDTGGFEGLRSGLSAEVSIFIDGREDATRIPLPAIRWVGGTAYAAIATAIDRSAYRWQPIQVGLMTPDYAEILGGLKRGDKVIAEPQNLPAPVAIPILQASGPEASGRES